MVRIHLPPAKSPVRTRFWARQRLLTKSGMGIYSPVTVSAVTKSLGDPAKPTLGLPQFVALGVALLGRSQAKGLWTCAITDPSNHKSGAVWVAGATRTAEVFFVATAQAAARLVLAGYVTNCSMRDLPHTCEAQRPRSAFTSSHRDRLSDVSRSERGAG